MKTTNKEGIAKIGLLMLAVGLIVISLLDFTISTPYGPSLISDSVETPDIGDANGLLMNHTKGRVIRTVLNATQPNADWKGYVGNISGKLKLIDADNNTLFDWALTTLSGEIFATRTSSSPTWTSIACAVKADISTENTAVGHGAEIDNVSNTFNETSHKQIQVGGVTLSADACGFTQYTYKNNVAQEDNFSEVVLYDGSDIVYASVLQNDAIGYDGGVNDFQMIIPDNQDLAVNLGYYFYVELA